MAYNKDLTTQYVSASFHKLLQISGSDNIVLDGTGSEVQLTFSTASGYFSGSFEGDGSGLVNVPGVSNQYELELMLKDTQQTYYKTLDYSGGLLSAINLWETSATSSLVFDKVLTYTSGLLSSFITTRYSDMATLTKNFVYDGSGNLTDINVITV